MLFTRFRTIAGCNFVFLAQPTCGDWDEARQYRLAAEWILMSQKYRQHGYQDRDRDRGTDEARQKQSAERPVKKETFGPRALQMPGSHTVSRCAQCGTLLTSISEPIGKCPKCGFELHSCRQCTYFDTSSRFECTQPIPERVARKDQRNQCTFYSVRVRVEKETSTPSSARPTDARTAFENLFKK
jgi:hypothetical protein